jgi:hypothetical protein
MQDQDALASGARSFIQGLRQIRTQGNNDFYKLFRAPPPRGVDLVERCARVVEEGCSGCQKPGCPRCTIAAELRFAGDRIRRERNAELAEFDFDDEDLEALVDKLVSWLCKDHVAFGVALAREWYGRQNFMKSTTRNEA